MKSAFFLYFPDCGIIVIVIGSVHGIQILTEVVSISHSANTLGKDMNPSVCQWTGRLGFNSRSSHTKDSKNGTWCHLA